MSQFPGRCCSNHGRTEYPTHRRQKVYINENCTLDRTLVTVIGKLIGNTQRMAGISNEGAESCKGSNVTNSRSGGPEGSNNNISDTTSSGDQGS